MKRKIIAALTAILSIGAISDDIILYTEASPTESVAVIESELYPHEVEIVVDWLETGVNTPAEIAARYKNPKNRYNILQAAIRRNVPTIGALTEVFYGNTNGVLPGGVNSEKVINDPAVTVPSPIPAAMGIPANTQINSPVSTMPMANNLLAGEAEYQQGLEYEQQRNDVEAFYYYKQAADKMHPKAAYKVAKMFYDGVGTTRNKDTALAYYKISANGGYDWGEYGYAWILIRDDYDRKEGLLWLQKAADHKNPRACYYLGEAYRTAYIFSTGVYNYIDEDKTKAIEYYRKARDTNTAEGYYYWGEMYYRGQLTEQNYAEAAKWFTKAMDMGYTDARDRLIRIYSYGGYGVDKNPAMVSKLEGKM